MTIRWRGPKSDSPDFERWYRDAFAPLLASMVVSAGDIELAREVTQDAFVRALENWDRVSGMESPNGWVYRVAVNRLRRIQRRASLERRLLRRSIVHDPRPPGELPVDVWDAVRRLSPRARTALGLRYLAGLPEAEVAAAMGVAPGTTARVLHDARRDLSDALAEDSTEVPHA